VRPAVTVITATYNWSSVLRHAIASVLAQSWEDFELLVIGDACTDDSAAVVAAFGDPRIRWHNLPENCGSQWGPNNEGLRRAQGRYVAYLGHDDLWFPRHLEFLQAELETSGAEFAFSLTELIYPDGPSWLSGLLPGDRFTTESFVVPSSLMHRREVVERIGAWPAAGDERLPVDVAWQQRALASGCRFVAVNRLTVLKFPSAARPMSYVNQDAYEQEAYRRRIETEPDFEVRRLVSVLRTTLDRPLAVHRAVLPTHVPPGWIAERNLEVRGLRERRMRDMEPLAPEVVASLFAVGLVQPPVTAVAGESFIVRCSVRNDSDHPLTSLGPCPMHLSYRWNDGSDSSSFVEPRRSVLPRTLEPGENFEAELSVEAPSKPGRYRLRPALVQEGHRWFTDTAPTVDREAWIEVIPARSTQSRCSPR
jgi:hypothetical protein